MEYVLTELQTDAVKELMNVGVNNSTNILSHILNAEINLKIPVVRFCKATEIMQELEILGSKELAAVTMEFKGAFSGISQLVFSQESANKLVNIFSRDLVSEDELDEVKAGALIEIGNIVLNATLAEFSNLFKDEFDFFVPNFYENYENDFYPSIYKYSDDVVLLGQTIFSIEEFKITGDIIIFMKIESFKHFISLIDKYIKIIESL